MVYYGKKSGKKTSLVKGCHLTIFFFLINLVRADPRIVGGTVSDRRDWKSIASLRSGPSARHICGASLVTERWVLTAAHCVDAVTNPESLNVDIGRFQKDAVDPTLQRIPVVNITIHPQWNRDTLQNDIAVLLLAFPPKLENGEVELSDIVTNKNQVHALLENSRCLTAGWGSTDNTGSNDELLEAEVKYFEFSTCKALLPQMRPGMLCAGNLNGGIGTCFGDSGGPLFCYIGKGATRKLLQVGLVSWSIGCAAPDKPGAYTDLAKYAEWYEYIFNRTLPPVSAHFSNPGNSLRFSMISPIALIFIALV